MKLNDKLEALAAHHERIAQAVRTTLAEMNGHDIKHAQVGFNGKLASAVKLRGGNGRPLGRPPKAAKKATMPGATAIATVLKDAGKRLTRDELRAGLQKLGEPGAMNAVGAAIRYGIIKSFGPAKRKSFEFKKMPGASEA